MASRSDPTPGDEFPLLCETCLGPNPYVRMTKLPPNNKLCQVSKLPMQSFRWKAGPTGRHKETVISYVVARDRNICQCCLMDLRFGLPAGVRDAILKQGSTSSTEIALPHSIPGLQQYYGGKKRAIEDADNTNNTHSASHIVSKVGGKGKNAGTASIWAEPEQGPSSSAVVMMGGGGGGTGSEEDVHNFRNQLAISQLERLSAQVHRNNVYHSGSTNTGQTTAAPTTTALRNLPKLCSFWLNGACNRVIRKTCPFRPCCGTFIFPEIIRNQKEIHEALVQRLTTEGPAVVMKNLNAETKAAFQQALKGVNREESIKKRITGDLEGDELAKKYLNRLQDQSTQLAPPEDPTIVTLWLGNLPHDVTEDELRGLLYPYGMIRSVRVVRMSKSPSPCAFIEYMDRANAEQAAAHLYRVLVIRGCSVSVNWAKPKAGSSSGSYGTTSSSISSDYGFLPPPPGLEQMHFTAYALPGMPLPMLHVPIASQAPQLSVPSALSSTVEESQGSQSKRRKVEEESNVVTGRDSSSVAIENIQQSSLGLDYLNAYDADD